MHAIENIIYAAQGDIETRSPQKLSLKRVAQWSVRMQDHLQMAKAKKPAAKKKK